MTVFQRVTGITDEVVAAAKADIGRELAIEQYNEVASYDTIRHYAHGIGDDNPLWCDEGYAAKSPFGRLVAPPTFLYSVFAPGIAPGLPGLQPLKAGDEWTFHRRVLRGDRIKASARLVDVEERKGGAGGRMLLQTGEVRYETVKGELLATLRAQSFRVARRGAEGGGLNYSEREQRLYTDQELDQIETDIFAEQVRGAEPRYWEDVRPEDQLQPVVKGPLDQITMTCYYAGSIGSSGYKASELRWKQWRIAREHPEKLPTNFDVSYFSERVLPSLGHQNDTVARAVGMPGAYDNGTQRIGWVTHTVTNWMGDDGFIRNLAVRIRRPNMFGNTTWCRGKVVRKFVDGDSHCVDLELWAENQDGEVNTKGSATVVLPARGK